jgi:hypothetical protein
VGTAHRSSRERYCKEALFAFRLIVLGVRFLAGVLRLGSILASGLLMLLGRAAVGIGKIAGQFSGGCLVLLGERLVHQG